MAATQEHSSSAAMRRGPRPSEQKKRFTVSSQGPQNQDIPDAPKRTTQRPKGPLRAPAVAHATLMVFPHLVLSLCGPSLAACSRARHSSEVAAGPSADICRSCLRAHPTPLKTWPRPCSPTRRGAIVDASEVAMMAALARAAHIPDLGQRPYFCRRRVCWAANPLVSPPARRQGIAACHVCRRPGRMSARSQQGRESHP